MKNSDLTKIFLDKFESGKLAHFYILKSSPRSHDPRTEVINFAINLVSEMIAKGLNIPIKNARERLLNGHQDTLFIPSLDFNKSQEHRYVKDDFQEFFRFLDYRAIELPWRFIVILEGHKISESISNLLLKSLEEPSPKTTILLLNHMNRRLLKTVESRAIKINLYPTENSNEQPDREIIWEQTVNLLEVTPLQKENLKKWFKEKGSINDLTELIKKNPAIEIPLIRGVLTIVNRNPQSFQDGHKIIEELKLLETAKSINLPLATRSLSLLNRIRE